MFREALLLSFLYKEVLNCITTKSPDGLPSVTTTTSSTTTTTTTPTNDRCQLCPDPYACDPSLSNCASEATLSGPPTVTRGTGECTFTVTPPPTGQVIYVQTSPGGPYTSYSSSTTTFTCGDYPNNQWMLPTGGTFIHVAVAN